MKRFTPLQRHKMIKISITACVVFAITSLCMIFPLRPKESSTEKRKLAQFPIFSFSSLADGSYFAGISLWFSDTVPFRDTFILINSKFQNFLGTAGALKGFNEGKMGDDIPDIPSLIPVENESAGVSTEPTVFPVEEEAQHIERLNSIFVCDNAGYEYYNFVKSVADNYASAINRAYSIFGDKADVYAAVVPTSMDITLNTKVRKKLSVSDQKEAIRYILGSVVDGVKKIDAFDNIKKHRNEYIYFRTDHHWTALGAYYAYEKFCEAKGIAPLKLDSFETLRFDGFLGSFYNDSGKDPALAATPDEVIAYKPPCEYSMTVTDKSGQSWVYPLFYDESKAPACNKYGAFICGDNPLSIIENHSLTEGENCVFVKESFGNAFAPFLVAHYKTVYVVDFRYYTHSLASLVNDQEIDDVIFLNNISMTRSGSLVRQLNERIG